MKGPRLVKKYTAEDETELNTETEDQTQLQ